MRNPSVPGASSGALDLPIEQAMSPWQLKPSEVRARYRTTLLHNAVPMEDGIAHTVDGELLLLTWDRVQRALTAEIGEPEGVRTIVFDLIISGTDAESPSDTGYDVRRFNADPGEDAMELARVLDDRLEPEVATASIKSVATDGIASRWYPDIEAFELDTVLSIED